MLGRETKAMNGSLVEFLDKHSAKVKQESNRVFELSEAGDKYTAFDDLQEYAVLYSNTSLCNFTKSLEGKKELCALLDNRIPERGFVQVYFRVMQYFEEIWSQIKDPEFDPKLLLKDEEFLELDYTIENIYNHALIFFEHQTHEYLEEYLGSKASETINLIISLMIAFISISSVFTFFSFLNIPRQVSRVVFSFQLLAINTIINNTGIKYRFLKVFNLNQKHL